MIRFLLLLVAMFATIAHAEPARQTTITGILKVKPNAIWIQLEGPRPISRAGLDLIFEHKGDESLARQLGGVRVSVTGEEGERSFRVKDGGVRVFRESK